MIPQHVAIIMDGNRRWAKGKHLPSVMGHRKVVEERVEELIDHAARLGINYVTFWAFSTENWERSQEEVNGIMTLFRWAFVHKVHKLVKKGARLQVIGDMSRFDEDIRKNMEHWMKVSQQNTAITVTFALNYGGRDEMIRAVRKLLEDVGGARHEVRINEKSLSNYLDTAGMPDPDLIIRTGGEQRLSGFMLWQCEYSEFYFTPILMPDFGTNELDAALEEYAKRERRRGK